MQGACNDFLARTGFTIDQDMGIGRGDIANQRAQLFHGRRTTDQARYFLAVAGQFGLERPVFKNQLPMGHGPARDIDEMIRVERFFDEIKRAFAHRTHRGGNVTMSGDKDHRHFRLNLAHLRQQFHAVHARHADISNQDSRPAAANTFQRRTGVAVAFDKDVGKLQRLLCGFPHIFVVIDKQNAMGRVIQMPSPFNPFRITGRSYDVPADPFPRLLFRRFGRMLYQASAMTSRLMCRHARTPVLCIAIQS